MLFLILCIMILTFVCGFMYIRQRALVKALKKYEDKDIKWSQFYYILVRWVYNYQNNMHIADYMRRNKYHTVAIYGVKELGEALFGDLKDTNIDVLYFIDREADRVITEIPVYKPEDNLPQVDIVIVTAVFYYADIESNLRKKGMNVVSLEEMLYEI